MRGSLYEPNELAITARSPHGRRVSMHCNVLLAYTRCESKIAKLWPTEDATTNRHQTTWPESKHPGARRAGDGSHSHQLIALLQVSTENTGSEVNAYVNHVESVES